MAALNKLSVLGFDCYQLSNAQTHSRISAHSNLSSFSQSFRPNFRPNSEELIPFRLKIFLSNKRPEKWFRVSTVSCFMEKISDECTEPIPSSVPKDSEQESSINLKLPRRSMLVKFTCNVCGARSQRLINRLAYERGLVYIQCSGCSQYHKLVDNLGLVVEYNLQEDVDDTITRTEQI